MEDALTVIEADREAAQAMLARYIAIDSPVAIDPAPPVQVDEASLRATLDHNPELLIADAAQSRASESVGLAKADKRPDFGVSVNYGRRDGQFGDAVSVVGSITLPIFAGRRQQPRIEAAQAEAYAARAERDDQLRVLEARFSTDMAQWRSAVTQWKRARDELLPLAQQRDELELASYAAGRASLLDVISARTALIELELEIVEREAAAILAGTKLRLTYVEHVR